MNKIADKFIDMFNNVNKHLIFSMSICALILFIAIAFLFIGSMASHLFNIWSGGVILTISLYIFFSSFVPFILYIVAYILGIIYLIIFRVYEIINLTCLIRKERKLKELTDEMNTYNL